MAEKTDKAAQADKPTRKIRFNVERLVEEGDGRKTRYEPFRTYVVSPDRAQHMIDRGIAEDADADQGIVNAEPEPITADDKNAAKSAEVEAREQAERDARAAREALAARPVETASITAPEAATTGETPAPRTVGRTAKSTRKGR